MSKTIIVNSEALEEINERLLTIRIYSETATDYAKSAESVFLNAGTCNALKRTVLNSLSNISNWIKTITETFKGIDSAGASNANNVTSTPVGSGSSNTSSSDSSWINNATGTNSSAVSSTNYQGYHNKTTAQDIKNYKGVVQPNNYDCTSCASTTVLQRWLVMNGKADKASGLQYQNVKSQMGGVWHINPKAISYDGNTFNLVGVGGYGNEGAARDLLASKSSTGNKQEGMAQLLMEHPEGIVFYSHYTSATNSDGWANPHAITITRFELKEDGTYQFYAQDPALKNAGGAEVRLEDTWLFNGHTSFYQSVDGLFDNPIAIQYLQSVS